jgi:hypothetical protein
MSVRYTISCEEFLECCEDYLPKPSVTSFVATLFIAAAVGVFGVVLTYAVDPGSKLMASTFCWLSLAVFLGAFWDLKMRTQRRRERLMKEYRAIYERLLRDEFVFDFNHQNFTSESEKGKVEVPWKGLLRAQERQNVITLGTSTIIPKRTLQSAELDSLRRMALPSAGNVWLFRVGLMDYLLVETGELWKRHSFLMAEAHAGGLLFFLMISSQMYNNSGPGVIWGWMTAFIFLFLSGTTQFWYFLLKYFTTHAELRVDRQVEFSVRGIRMQTDKSHWFSSWQTFPKFRETGRAFLLYIDTVHYHLFPKSCLTWQQQDTVRQMLQTELAHH